MPPAATPPRQPSQAPPPGDGTPARTRWLIAAAVFVVVVAGWWGVQNWFFPARHPLADASSNGDRSADDRPIAEQSPDLARQTAAAHIPVLAPFDSPASVGIRVPRETVVDDPAGKLLWASPTAGPPIGLAYVPAGTQCLVYLRPALLAAHPEGEKVLAALGPWGQSAVTQLQSIAGAKLTEIDAVLASIVVRPGGALDACLRVELVDSCDAAEFAARIPNAKSQDHDGTMLLTAGDRAWFMPRGAEGASSRTLVACPADLAADLIDSAGDPPLLARDLESLVAQSDADRAATILLEPKFLLAGGNHLVEGEASPLRDALAVLVGRDATAVELSAHWGDSFFVELRAAPALTVSPRWLATTLASRLGTAATFIEGEIKMQAWPDYGRAVLQRFPAMFTRLAESARHAEADKQAVVRAYLPPVAGHNLLMGAELLLTQSGGGASGGDGAAAVARRPKTLDERLAAVTTLTFPKESLQRALELLSADIGVPIAVDGPAFQAAGVTQNQTMELELRERPAAEILVEILRRANPDRAATGPADPRQTLVYIVEPAAAGDAGDGAAGRGSRAAGGGGRIIVTTRAAAASRGAKLPAVFGVPGE